MVLIFLNRLFRIVKSPDFYNCRVRRPHLIIKFTFCFLGGVRTYSVLMKGSAVAEAQTKGERSVVIKANGMSWEKQQFTVWVLNASAARQRPGKKYYEAYEPTVYICLVFYLSLKYRSQSSYFKNSVLMLYCRKYIDDEEDNKNNNMVTTSS